MPSATEGKSKRDDRDVEGNDENDTHKAANKTPTRTRATYHTTPAAAGNVWWAGEAAHEGFATGGASPETITNSHLFPEGVSKFASRVDEPDQVAFKTVVAQRACNTEPLATLLTSKREE
jgi:hypothetical protein